MPWRTRRRTVDTWRCVHLDACERLGLLGAPITEGDGCLGDHAQVLLRSEPGEGRIHIEQSPPLMFVGNAGRAEHAHRGLARLHRPACYDLFMACVYVHALSGIAFCGR